MATYGDGKLDRNQSATSHFKWDFASALSQIPASPSTGDVLEWTATVTGLTGFKALDGTTDKTSATDEDVFQYDGTHWLQKDSLPARTPFNVKDVAAGALARTDKVVAADVSATGDPNISGTIESLFGLMLPKDIRPDVLAAKTADYTVTTSDEGKVIPGNTASGSLTLTLPDLGSGDAGFTLYIVKTAAANTLTIDGHSTDTINSTDTLVLTALYQTVALRWLGSGWVLIAEPMGAAARAKLDAGTFGAVISRNVVGNTTNAIGEAVVSTGNPTTYGVTDFLGIDKDEDAGLLNSLAAGDFFEFTLGDKVIIAEIAGAQDAINDTAVKEVWYKPAIYSIGLDSNGEPGTGAATIQFSIAATDLRVTRTATTVEIQSSNGAKAVLSGADATSAGIFTAADKNALTSDITVVRTQAALDAVATVPVVSAVLVLAAFGTYQPGDILFYDHKASAWELLITGKQIPVGGQVAFPGYQVRATTTAGSLTYAANNTQLQINPLSVYDELFLTKAVYSGRRAILNTACTIAFTGAFGSPQSGVMTADFKVIIGTLPATGAVTLTLLDDLVRQSHLKSEAINPNQSLSELYTLSEKGIGETLTAYPPAWTGQFYTEGEQVRYSDGDVYYANQTVPLHEPPPPKSSKWTRRSPTRLRSAAVHVDDTISLKFNNLTGVTGATAPLLWQQGSLHEDVIDVDGTTGIGTADVGYTADLLFTAAFPSFQLTLNYTGTSSNDFTLNFQTRYNNDAWATVSSFVSGLSGTGIAIDGTFSGPDVDLNAADTSTLRWRMQLVMPSGTTLTNYDLTWNDHGTAPWFRYEATLPGDAYEMLIDGDGLGKVVKVSDGSEKVLTTGAHPVDLFGTSLPSTGVQGQSLTLTADTNSLTAATAKKTRTAETTTADFVSSPDGKVTVGTIGSDTGLFIGNPSGEQMGAFLALGSGDEIVCVDGTGAKVTFALTAAPTYAASTRYLSVVSTNYTLTGSLVDGTVYTVYAIKTATGYKQGDVFQWDGTYWNFVFDEPVEPPRGVEGLVALGNKTIDIQNNAIWYATDIEIDAARQTKTSLLMLQLNGLSADLGDSLPFFFIGSNWAALTAATAGDTRSTGNGTYMRFHIGDDTSNVTYYGYVGRTSDNKLLVSLATTIDPSPLRLYAVEGADGVPLTASAANIGTSFVTLSDGLNMDESYEIGMVVTAGSDLDLASDRFRFGDLPLNSEVGIALSAQGDNYRLIIKRTDATTLQVRRGTGINASNVVRLWRAAEKSETPAKFTQYKGTRRQMFAKPTLTISNGYAAFLTQAITPSAANRTIRVRGTAILSPPDATPNNSRINLYLKMKKGTANYTGLSGSGSRTWIGSSRISENYDDWSIVAVPFEFLITAADTDTLQFHIEGSLFETGARQNTGSIKANTCTTTSSNSDKDVEVCSWLEVAELSATSQLTDGITVTTVTTADAA